MLVSRSIWLCFGSSDVERKSILLLSFYLVVLPPFSVLPYLPSVIKSESFSLRVYGLWRARGRHSDRLLCADFARGPWPSTTRRVSQRPAALREEARLTGRLDPSHIYSHFPPPPKRETSDASQRDPPACGRRVRPLFVVIAAAQPGRSRSRISGGRSGGCRDCRRRRCCCCCCSRRRCAVTDVGLCLGRRSFLR